MDSMYEPLQQQADKLQFRCHDLLADQSDDLAQDLKRQSVEVREDIKQNKAPQAVEARIRSIEQVLQRVKATGANALAATNAGKLLTEYEDLRRSLRSMPNYSRTIV